MAIRTTISCIAVTGRFQPFHLDHLELVTYALDRAERLLVGVTNPDARSLAPAAASSHRHLRSSNPFTYLERLRMIRAALNAAGVASTRYEIVPFPLDDPGVWRAYVPKGTMQLVRAFSAWERQKAAHLEAAGYPVILLQGDVEGRVSASDIRRAIARGEPWAHWVPAGVLEVLLAFGEETLRRRCALGPELARAL